MARTASYTVLYTGCGSPGCRHPSGASGTATSGLVIDPGMVCHRS